MKTAEIDLRFDQVAGLKKVANLTGRTEGELIRSGIDIVIAKEVAQAMKDRGLAKMLGADLPQPVVELRLAWAQLRAQADKFAAGEA